MSKETTIIKMAKKVKTEVYKPKSIFSSFAFQISIDNFERNINMKSEKKLEILEAIRDDKPYSRNNKDMAFLQANGYIDCQSVINCSYKDAVITLADWGIAYIDLVKREMEREGKI